MQSLSLSRCLRNEMDKKHDVKKTIKRERSIKLCKTLNNMKIQPKNPFLHYCIARSKKLQQKKITQNIYNKQFLRNRKSHQQNPRESKYKKYKR